MRIFSEISSISQGISWPVTNCCSIDLRRNWSLCPLAALDLLLFSDWNFHRVYVFYINQLYIHYVDPLCYTSNIKRNVSRTRQAALFELATSPQQSLRFWQTNSGDHEEDYIETSVPHCCLLCIYQAFTWEENNGSVARSWAQIGSDDDKSILHLHATYRVTLYQQKKSVEILLKSFQISI